MANEYPLTNSNLLVTSAIGIAAYGGTLPVPIPDTNGRDGWLYTGKTGTQECNIDIYKEGYLPTQLGHILDAFFVATLDDNSSTNNIPYLAVYTKPQGAGDYSPGNYRSRRTYKHKPNAAISVGETLQFSINRQPETKYPVGQIHLEKQELQGPGGATEDILKIQIEIDGFSNNNTQVLFQFAGWKSQIFVDSPHIKFSGYDKIEEILQDPTKQVTRIVGSNDINGGAPHRYLTVEANGRLLTIPHMPTTNSRLLDLVNKTPDKLTFSSSHSLTIAAGGTQTTPVTDLGADTTPLKIQLAGTTTNTVDVVVQVSNDNVTFYNYKTPMISVVAGEIYAEFDLAFRYYKLEVTDSSGLGATVDLIESGKSL